MATNVFYYNVNMWLMEDNRGLLHFSEGYAGNPGPFRGTEKNVRFSLGIVLRLDFFLVKLGKVPELPFRS